MFIVTLALFVQIYLFTQTLVSALVIPMPSETRGAQTSDISLLPTAHLPLPHVYPVSLHR